MPRGKFGNKNPQWKGEDVGYNALHYWIKCNKSKPEFCEECKKSKPYDLANVSGEYKRDVNDFEWLCRSCHMKKDGRMKNLEQNHKRRKINSKNQLKCNKCLKFKDKQSFGLEKGRGDERKLSCRRCSKEYNQRPEVKARKKEYAQRTEVKARIKEYAQRPEVKARKKEYAQRTEVKERKKEKAKEYYQRPEVKARIKEYRLKNRERINKRMKKYNQRPEVKARKKEYNRRPEIKARRAAKNRRSRL